MECLHVGEPPSNFGSWESKTIYIHNFLDLPDTKDDGNVMLSPEFKCFGHTWRLDVYPGGNRDSKDGWVSVYISNLSNKKIALDYRITVLKADGKESEWTNEGVKVEFEQYEVGVCEHTSWGDDTLKRATIVQHQYRYLVNGALTIRVDMRQSGGLYRSSIPRHLPDTDYMNIFGSEKTSDIAFDFKGDIVVAHKCIIESKAKEFYDLCEEHSVTSPMIIADVDKNIFTIMLRSLYGDGVFPEEWQEHSEAILKAANKYGFDALKSEAEEWYTDSLNFTVDSVIDEFMKADGKNHSLVKTAAKKFIMDHKEEVVASESLNRLYESKELMIEVMQAFASGDSKKRKRES